MILILLDLVKNLIALVDASVINYNIKMILTKPIEIQKRKMTKRWKEPNRMMWSRGVRVRIRFRSLFVIYDT